MIKLWQICLILVFLPNNPSMFSFIKCDLIVKKVCTKWSSFRRILEQMQRLREKEREREEDEIDGHAMSNSLEEVSISSYSTESCWGFSNFRTVRVWSLCCGQHRHSGCGALVKPLAGLLSLPRNFWSFQWIYPSHRLLRCTLFRRAFR